MSNITTLNLKTPAGKAVILTLNGADPDTISVDGAAAVKADKICQIAGRGVIKAVPAAKSVIDPDHIYYRVVYAINGKLGACLLDKASGDQLGAVLDEQRAAAKAVHDALLAANVPGLDELLKAVNDHAYYHEQFACAMEDEYNDGVNMPRHPTSDIDALSAQYPRAALWIKADNYEDASNYHKSSAGRRAKAMIEAGEPLEAVQDVLDHWLPASAMWD